MVTKISKYRRLIVFLLVIVCVLSLKTNTVYADGLVVRSVDDYNVDFTQMGLGDYCLFFVQDINLKYGKGHHCTGDGRSTGILDYGNLQDICINELNGGDNGLDCSSFVHIVCKYFGADIATGTSILNNASVGGSINEIINAKDDPSKLGEMGVGDVVLTITDEGQGHVLICVGSFKGDLSMVHIGSSKLCCKDQEIPVSSTTCTITPGTGVTFGEDHTAFTDSGSGQNKRFVRVASVTGYFGGTSYSEVNKLQTCKIFKLNYTRTVGGDPTGSSMGVSVDTMYSWIQKTGTLYEESNIPGMPGTFDFEGEPIVLTDRNGLAMTDVEAVSTIGTAMGYNKLSVYTIMSRISVFLGYLLLLYGFLLLLAYFFDCSNNFIDMSTMGILTMGKWVVIDDMDVKKTIKKNGKTYVTRTGMIMRVIIIWVVALVLVSGVLLNGIGNILNMIYARF